MFKMRPHYRVQKISLIGDQNKTENDVLITFLET
jgi:hypothetical protein